MRDKVYISMLTRMLLIIGILPSMRVATINMLEGIGKVNNMKEEPESINQGRKIVMLRGREIVLIIKQEIVLVFVLGIALNRESPYK